MSLRRERAQAMAYVTGIVSDGYPDHDLGSLHPDPGCAGVWLARLVGPEEVWLLVTLGADPSFEEVIPTAAQVKRLEVR